MTAEKKPVILKSEVKERIRKEFKRGKRIITLDGRSFRLHLRINNTTDQDGKPIKQKWIVISPADGSLVPTAHIEHEHQKNSKVITTK